MHSQCDLTQIINLWIMIIQYGYTRLKLQPQDKIEMEAISKVVYGKITLESQVPAHKKFFPKSNKNATLRISAT